MPNFERGSYEPGEDVRVFDGSEDDEDVEGSRLPLLIVLALLVLAMFGGVVWLAYNEGVTRGRTETPVVTAANGPARVAPANPGGTEQPFKGFKIYEQPAPPDDDVAANGAKSGATPAKPATSAAPEKIAPPPAPKPAITANAAPAPESKPVATAPPPAAKPVATNAVPKPAPAPVAKATPPKPVAIGPATAPPRSLAVAPPAAAPVKAAVASGSVVLQIGAYKSQADADAAWKTYRAKHAALLDGYNSDVQQADLGDKGTWYRLRIAGFASKDLASALCDRLKADGGTCFLGK